MGREIHIIDYTESNGKALEDYAMVLRNKSYQYGFHYLPHDIKVRELGTGRSRYEILGQHLGMNTLMVVPNIPVKDGIDAARKVFPRCWFDKDACPALLDALGSYSQEWDDKKGMFRDKPLHNWASHTADAFRMLAVGLKDETSVKVNPVKSKYSHNDPFKKIKPIKSKYNSSFL